MSYPFMFRVCGCAFTLPIHRSGYVQLQTLGQKSVGEPAGVSPMALIFTSERNGASAVSGSQVSRRVVARRISRRALAPVGTLVPAQTGASALRLIHRFAPAAR